MLTTHEGRRMTEDGHWVLVIANLEPDDLSETFTVDVLAKLLR